MNFDDVVDDVAAADVVIVDSCDEIYCYCWWLNEALVN